MGVSVLTSQPTRRARRGRKGRRKKGKKSKKKEKEEEEAVESPVEAPQESAPDKKKKKKGPVKSHPAELLAVAEAAQKKKGRSMKDAHKQKELQKEANALKGPVGDDADELIRRTIEKRAQVVAKLPHVNVRHMLREEDKENRAALQLAVHYKHPDLV